MTRSELAVSSRSRLLLVLIPLAAALAAHFWTIRSIFVNYDVHYFLLENKLTVSPFGSGFFELVATPQLGYPIPVTVLVFAAQRAFFDLEPMGFHAVSLALHLGVVGLAYALALRLGATARVAAVLTSMFAIHPLTVEPVAWVVGQKDLIATILVLSALIVRSHPDGAGRRRTLVVFVLSVLALLSKPSAVCMPVLLAVIDWSRSRELKKNLALYIGVALLAVCVIALSIWSHEKYTQVGVSRAFSARSFIDAAWAVSLQALHVFAPTELTPRYFEPDGLRLFAGAALGLAITAALFWIIVTRARAGDRLTAAGVLLFGAAYGPVAGIIPITRGPADSYMYLPLALLAATMGPALGRFAVRSKKLVVPLVVVAGLALTALSASAHDNWSSPRRLWSALLDKYPDNPVAKLRMAQTFFYERRLDLTLGALEQIEKDHAPSGYTNHRWFWADALAMSKQFQAADAVYTLAARTQEPEELERYGYFLVGARVTPTSPELARAALAHIGPGLARSGDNPRILARAARLAESLGLDELAIDLKERLAEQQTPP